MVAVLKTKPDLISVPVALSAFAQDVLKGLRGARKTVPPKYFYDAIGSQLFEQITQQPEYYPTRTELTILEKNAAAIAAIISDHAALVEFGSGASRKTRIVLQAAKQLDAYVPVEICGDMLDDQARALRAEFPALKVLPVEADFTQPFALPAEIESLPKVGFFPGSTIGNFEPHQAAAFMRNAGEILGENSIFIVGVDLIKDSDVLHDAYNDAAGVTEAFNLNLLTRINKELGGTFNPDTFEHHAFFNRERNRVEMHLASSKRQKIRVLGECVDFRIGETIHTENSYKYSLETFGALARGTGWQPTASWTDPDKLFSVHALTYTR
jgi:dimethylhistidine N-methyltransferase